MDGEVRINPYLSGNFAPVRSEDDFELAVKFGATHVRVGTAIFGARDYSTTT